jgi:hypothetical protein
MPETSTLPSLAEMATTIKNWWEAHKYDTRGPSDERNVFDAEPQFVTMAKAVIGDWESGGSLSSQPGAEAEEAKGWFDVNAYATKEAYEAANSTEMLDGFLQLTGAIAYGESDAFKDYYQVKVIAYGEHPEWEPHETAWERFPGRTD